MALRNKQYILLLIIALAIFFRFFQLNSIPKGLYHDEAINGNDAFFSLKDGDYKVVYPENNGREGIFIWLISLAFSLFNVSVWSLKLIPALIGTLTVLGLYLFIKELFSLNTKYEGQSTNIALLSSFFLAVSFWHINFSRIAFRAILVPFILVYSFYFLIKGFKKQKMPYLGIAGMIFGLGFYTYSVFRLAVMLLATALLALILLYKDQISRKKLLIYISYFLLAVVIIAFPLLIYFTQNPEMFLGRTGQVSVFAQENPIKAFIQSMLIHLASFNFYGDANWRHNFSGSPQLYFPIGILFLIGIFISFKKLINSLKQKNYSLFAIHFILISWLLIMTIPAALTYERIPHALRMIGTIPVAYIFAGIGGLWMYNWLSKKINKKLFTAICLLFVAFLTFAQFQKYFIAWANHPEIENAFSYNYKKIGDYLNSLSDETQKIIIVNVSGVPVPYPDGIPMPTQSIIFTEIEKYKQIRSFYILEKDLMKIEIEKPSVIIPMKYDKDLFEKIKTLSPDGIINNQNGIIFYEIQS